MTRLQARHRKQWRFTGDGPWTYEASAKARQALYDAQQQNAENFKAAAEQRDIAAVERCQALYEGYGEALAEVGERDVAASRRVLWENQERQRLNSRRWARYDQASGVLRAARSGDLKPDWRTDLASGRPDIAASMRDVYAAVATEFADLPPQPWEPWAASGDWRAALDAWHHDSLAVLDTYYQGEMADAQTPYARFGPDSAELEQREAQRQIMATKMATNLERSARARIEHAYQSGLAAGENPADSANPLPSYWMFTE